MIHFPHEPALDPNWFYSSLSQAAAALIGLLGAIMATQLDVQRREARRARDEFENAVVAARKSMEEFRSLFRGHANDLGPLLASLEETRAASTLDELQKAAIGLVESSKSFMNSEHRGRVVDRYIGMATISHAELRRKADGRVYERLLIVLVLLSVAGLLAPLFFLSARDTLSKGILLGGFGLGVVGLLVFVAYQVRYLRRIQTRALTFSR